MVWITLRIFRDQELRNQKELILNSQVAAE